MVMIKIHINIPANKYPKNKVMPKVKSQIILTKVTKTDIIAEDDLSVILSASTTSLPKGKADSFAISIADRNKGIPMIDNANNMPPTIQVKAMYHPPNKNHIKLPKVFVI